MPPPSIMKGNDFNELPWQGPPTQSPEFFRNNAPCVEQIINAVSLVRKTLGDQLSSVPVWGHRFRYI